VFGITPLGIHDNFFALGADSLMAVAVVSHLKEHFGVQLTAVHLYEALDIASLATIIDEIVAESLQVTTVSSSLPVVCGSSGME
jgi:acyl carrier protein